MRTRALALLLATAGCKQSKSDAPAKQVDEAKGGVLLGIRPEKWVCENVAPVGDLATILGATPEPMETPMSSSPGLAKPCTYTITTAGGPGADAGAASTVVWTFDLDCRPGHEERAETELAQWAAAASEQVGEYQRKVGTGKAPTDDAGVAYVAPEGAREVAVGRRGLDVMGQGLIFVDDDAPCNVRVVGPDADKRLAVAQLVARNLSEANAPMTPHQPRPR
jgi:hypothetical protein